MRLSPHTSGLVISVKSYSEEAGQYRFPMISISKSRAKAKRLGSIGSSYSVIIKYSDNEQENAFTMDCFNITELLRYYWCPEFIRFCIRMTSI